MSSPALTPYKMLGHSESDYSLISPATSASDLNSRPASPDTGLSTREYSEHDRIASQMQETLTRCRPEFRNFLAADLPSGVRGASINTLLDQVDHSFTSPTELQARCAEFIEEFKDDPHVVSLVVRYISAQAMLIDGLEKQMLAQQKSSDPTLENGLDSFIAHAQSEEKNPSELLKKTAFTPVKTAHPTQISRVGSVELFSESPVTHSALAQAAWNSQGAREKAPTVLDEVEQFQGALGRIIKSGHRLHKQMNAQLIARGEEALDQGVITVGSWPAGDRDGNPNITAQTLIDAVALNSQTVLGYYSKKFSPNKLTKPSESGPANLQQLLEKAGQSEQAESIFAKLGNTASALGKDLTERTNLALYHTPEKLIEDLNQLNLTELDADEKALATRKVSSLIADIRAHGFHGVTTDIRQNSAVNHNTIEILLILNGLLDNVDYKTLPEGEKQKLLQSLLDQKGGLNWIDSFENLPAEILTRLEKSFPADGEGKSNKALAQFKQEIELIHSYKTIHDRFGHQALQNCITANTEQVSDLMEVMVLLRHAGVAGTTEEGQPYCHMNVVPLIETVDDLKNSKTILEGLIGNTWYKNALVHTDSPQMVMVGYSDSARLAGSFASNWEVYKATQAMVEIGKDEGVKLLFFHGRGGTEARGAGVDYADEIGIHSRASLENGFRQTDQGEMVTARYGNQTLADIHLDELVGSTLQGMSTPDDQNPPEAWLHVMDFVAEKSEKEYRTLYTDQSLVPFFQASTPLDHIGKANAGSRPPKRVEGGELRLESLRAIPSAAAWIQSGLMVPAFYGTGSGINEYLDQAKTPTEKMQRINTLREMYRAWPMFKNLIDRTEMALSKFDSQGVAERSLSNTASHSLLGQIEDESRKTVNAVNLIKNQGSLLEGRSPEKQRLKVRMKPLAWARGLQQELLGLANNSPSKAEQFKKPIVESMQAVAHALGRFG